MSSILEIIILIAAMAGVGIIIAALAGLIWKDNRPIGVSGDYIASILSAITLAALDVSKPSWSGGGSNPIDPPHMGASH